MRKLLLFFLFFVLFMSGEIPGQKNDKFLVTRVKAVVSPTEFEGQCPQTFLFAGRITTNGKGKVKYQWQRNDGTKSSIRTAIFTEPGTQIVTTTWTLGDFGESYEEYWQVLKILSPNEISTNEAVFTLICTPESKEEGGIFYDDIDVTDIYLDERCRLHVKHSNRGTRKLNMLLRERVWVDNRLVYDGKEAIIIGSRQQFSHPVGSESGLFIPGYSTVRIEIDADNELKELNEKNNIMKKQVNCRK